MDSMGNVMNLVDSNTGGVAAEYEYGPCTSCRNARPDRRLIARTSTSGFIAAVFNIRMGGLYN